MDDARSELQRLGRYKHDLQQEVEKISRNKDFSDDDLAELLGAANEILAEKGIAPIELNPMSRLALRVQNSIYWNNNENGEEGYEE